MKKIIMILALLVVGFVFTGCGDERHSINHGRHEAPRHMPVHHR